MAFYYKTYSDTTVPDKILYYYSNSNTGGPSAGTHGTTTVSEWMADDANLHKPHYGTGRQTAVYQIIGSKLVLPEDSTYLFSFTSGTDGLNFRISAVDTSNVKNMSYLFFYSRELTSLDLSSWNTSNVTNLDYAIYNCTSLQTINLTGWDVSNVTSFGQMFGQDSSLETITVSNHTDWAKDSKATVGSIIVFDTTKLRTYDGSWLGNGLDHANNTSRSWGYFSPLSTWTLNFYVDSTLWKTVNVKVDDSASDYIKEEPFKDMHWKFVEWRDSNGNPFNMSATVTSDGNYYAYFKKVYYMYFVTDYGNAPWRQCIDEGGTPSNPGSISYEHFVFEGWYTSKDYTTLFDFANTRMYEDHYAYAKWKKRFAISFYNYDNTLLEYKIVDENVVPSYTGTVTPTKKNDYDGTYTFSGWSPDPVAVVDDANYVAKFSVSDPVPYIYLKDGGYTVVTMFIKDNGVWYKSLPYIKYSRVWKELEVK